MALVIGTNCGFVTTAPTSDPDGNLVLAGRNTSTCVQDTAPTGSTKITEIGWYCNVDKPTCNFEVGAYNDDTDAPKDLLSGVDETNTKTTGIGWKVVTGLNIPITEGTLYWIAVNINYTLNVNSPKMDGQSGATGNRAYDMVSTLEDPWTGYESSGSIAGIYAITDASVPTGTNTQINIGDEWKEIAAVQINIGDTWHAVEGMQINIGDSWKTVF